MYVLTVYLLFIIIVVVIITITTVTVITLICTTLLAVSLKYTFRLEGLETEADGGQGQGFQWDETGLHQIGIARLEDNCFDSLAIMQCCMQRKILRYKKERNQ